jgi:hypothetical protein
MSRNSPVDITTGYGLEDRGSIPDRYTKCFLLHIVHTDCGAHPAYYSMHTWGSFLGDKEDEA